MKRIKKICSVLLAMVMILAMAVPAMADTAPTGSITIKNATVKTTYTVYKVFDATYGGGEDEDAIISYTVDESYAIKSVIDGDPNAPFTIDVNNTVEVKEGAADSAVIDWLKEQDVTSYIYVDEKTVTEGNTITFSGLPYGYYYIVSSTGNKAAITIGSVYGEEAVELYDKNDQEPHKPEDGKLKKVVDAQGDEIDMSTAAIGETVNFKVSFVATNYETRDGESAQITEYTVVDTPSGMEIDGNSVEISVDGVDLSSENEEYEVEIDSATGEMTIRIPWADTDDNGDYTETSLYDSPATVVITYSAVITAEVLDDPNNGKATNEAIVNNDNNLAGDTETTVYSITVKKIDEDENELDGAQFELYDAETGGNKIHLVTVYTDETETEVDYYRVATEEDEITDETSAKIEAGTAVIKGLNGESTKAYYLEEVTAPDGYNKLTERYKVAMSGADGNAMVTVNVENKAGSILPSTGGMGTRLFYLVGGILVAAAGVLLISRKRMEREI